MYNKDKIHDFDTKIDKFRIKIKDSSDKQVLDDVFDTKTLEALYKLSRKGYIKNIGGSISAGKEANVFHAYSDMENISNEIAIKIYLITTSNFNTMKDYIIGDPRFGKIKHRKKDIIFEWAKKEFKNLKRAYDSGVNVPEPYLVTRNIILMKFIGRDGVPMPILKNANLTKKELEYVFNKIIEYLILLKSKAKLIHADLSEYNILIDMDNIEPVIIDMGQSVTLEHTNAINFLNRDINNICKFFSKHGINVNKNEILSKITEV